LWPAHIVRRGRRHWISVGPVGFCILLASWVIAWAMFLLVVLVVLLISAVAWLVTAGWRKP
jgi:hypothetical protein